MNNLLKLVLLLVLAYMMFDFMKNKILEPFVYTPNELFTHLLYITNVLTQHDIKHWITYGTLLGAVRDKDIITYDYDFDLGCMIEDEKKILDLNPIIKKDSYEFVKTIGTLYNVKNHTEESGSRVSLKIVYKDIIMGDIYLYHLCPDGFVRRYDPNAKILFWPKATLHSYFTDNLIKIKIRDNEFFCPKDPEFLVSYWYGPTWKSPIKSESQGGTHVENYDYYGGYIGLTLNTMTEYLQNVDEIERVPNVDFDVTYVYPFEQLDWFIKNEINVK